MDSGKLTGSFFHHSVVLICTHTPEGALGLTLNRPADGTLGVALDVDLPERLKEQPLYMGGPVEPSGLSYLHSSEFLPDANVIENLSLGHSIEELSDLGESLSASQRVRVFAGYAGWAPGQLESELKRQAWLIHPASLDLVFEVQTSNLWSSILKKKGGWKNRILAASPEDLSWN